MWYGVVFIPEENHPELGEFRKKYDPTYDMLSEEHMTILYPVPESIGYKKLDEHLAEKIDGVPSFRIHFSGLRKSWDHWLLLNALEGSEKVIEIRDNIYSGLLRPYLREDLPYHPYMGLGLFAEDDYDPLNPGKTGFRAALYQNAYREAVSLNIDFWSVVDRLTLVRLTTMDVPIERIKEYPLRR